MSRRLLVIGGRTPRDLALVGSMIIGRDPMCDVSEEDPLLSRRHAEFVAGPNSVVVRDLGSRNGILVNGVKRTEALLRGGDLVQIGHLQVKLVERPGPLLDSHEPDADATIVVSSGAGGGNSEPSIANATEVRHGPPGMPTIGRGTASPSNVKEGTNAARPGESETDWAPRGERQPEADDLDRTLPTPNPPAAPAANEICERSPVDTRSQGLPGSAILFEMPRDDWQVVPGGATALLSLAHKQGLAAVVIERVRIARLAGWSERGDGFASSEAAAARDQPTAADIDVRLVSIDARQLAIVSYARTGIAGPERVRQYSIPAGSDLYRLTCSAVASQFARFEPIFAHVAATFVMGTRP